MSSFFILLFFILGGCLIAGLIKPSIFSNLFKRNLARKQIGLIFGISAFVFLILGTAFATPKPEEEIIPPIKPVTETKEVKETQAVVFQYTNENNESLPQGQTKIKQEGKNGSKEILYRVTYTDRKETKREKLSETVTVQPVTQITSVGTYAAPPPAPDTSGGGSGYTNVDGNQVPSPSSNPAGATARCGDGTYSYSQHRQGTCSHHGGVAEWL